MRFDATKIRKTRTTMQLSALPILVVSALALSHSNPILSIILCFAAIGSLFCAVVAGVVEEQVVEQGSPWLWRWANRFPRMVSEILPSVQTFGYRDPPLIIERCVFERKVHRATRVVALMPVWMGGRGLGWRLFKRSAIRSFNEWDRTPSGPGDRFVQAIVDELRRRERFENSRSTHVGCTGRKCQHCQNVASRLGGM